MDDALNVPSRDDIDVYHSLDELEAVANFVGKSQKEAETLFQESSYLDDLLFMGPKAFVFYLTAAVNYVVSEASAGDDSILSEMLIAVSYRAESGFDILNDDVIRSVDFVLENYARFEVDETSYGDLRAQFQDLNARLSEELVARAGSIQQDD